MACSLVYISIFVLFHLNIRTVNGKQERAVEHEVGANNWSRHSAESNAVYQVEDKGNASNGTLSCKSESASVHRLSNCNSSNSWVYTINNGQSNCGVIPHNIMECGGDMQVLILACNCATFDATGGALEVGQCIYNCGRRNISSLGLGITIPLPKKMTQLNEFQCGGLNRRGTLCGQCKLNQYPLAYSFDMRCVDCPETNAYWWRYILVAYLPLTLFYFVILLFNVNVTSSILTGFVTSCQAMAIPIVLRAVMMGSRGHNEAMQVAIRSIASFYGIWNLDFFRSFNLGICLKLTTLQILTLDIAIGVYPLLLILLTYLLVTLYDLNFKPLVTLWKPFQMLLQLLHSTVRVRTSLIDAFATFFFLSNVKFLNVSYDLLIPVVVYRLDSSGNLTKSWRLYYDATIPYFGETHLPYASLAIVVFTLFVVLPTLLLLLYPFRWFQKALNLLPFRWYILHTFIDAFHGCYKDGTEPGTRDCRWFATATIFFRIFIFTIYSSTLNILYYPIFSMALVLYIIVQLQVQPFKIDRSHLSTANALFLILLAMWHVSIMVLELSEESGSSLYFTFPVIQILITLIFTIFLLVLMAHWICGRGRGRCATQLIGKLYMWRHGYHQLE